MTNWTPRGVNPSAHPVLVDGVPQWMMSPLRTWFKSQFTYRTNTRLPVIQPWKGRMEEYDLASRRTPWAEDLGNYGTDPVFDVLGADELLRIFDWLIFDNATNTKRGNDDLDGILAAGGSLWKVGERDGVPGLERRVPEGVQVAAETLMVAPGHPGLLLSEAWHAVFGLNPDFEKAYAKSIKAVEAAVIPIVSPTNALATLGTVISQMGSEGDWRLAMSREHTTHRTQQVVLSTAQALWTGQNDRHAGQAGYMPSTRADAEAAVTFAVSLVQWFTSGAVARR
jgi:hypothetical protein